MKVFDIVEGKSPHKKGTKKYKKHMAAMHANMGESNIVLDQGRLRSYIISMIADKIAQTDDIEQLAEWLKLIVGKELNPRGSRYMISDEDIKEAFLEAHGNSKVYDKCWKGYRRVPGKKRGEKGSCKKIGETATAGATASGNIASVANPRAAYAKIKRDKNGVPQAPQRKNPDGTTKNALDTSDTLMASKKPKTIKRTS